MLAFSPLPSTRSLLFFSFEVKVIERGARMDDDSLCELLRDVDAKLASLRRSARPFKAHVIAGLGSSGLGVYAEVFERRSRCEAIQGYLNDSKRRAKEGGCDLKALEERHRTAEVIAQCRRQEQREATIAKQREDKMKAEKLIEARGEANKQWLAQQHREAQSQREEARRLVEERKEEKLQAVLRSRAARSEELAAEQLMRDEQEMLRLQRIAAIRHVIHDVRHNIVGAGEAALMQKRENVRSMKQRLQQDEHRIVESAKRQTSILKKRNGEVKEVHAVVLNNTLVELHESKKAAVDLVKHPPNADAIRAAQELRRVELSERRRRERELETSIRSASAMF
jgi:hypothetical protein